MEAAKRVSAEPGEKTICVNQCNLWTFFFVLIRGQKSVKIRVTIYGPMNEFHL